MVEFFFSEADTTTPKTRDVVMGLLSGEAKGRVLDAGAGPGTLSRMLSSAGFKVSACDINPGVFSQEGLRCDKADLSGRLPYQDAEFDHVVLIDTLEHLENPWNAVRELSRVLKRGGLVIVATPNVLHVVYRIAVLLTGETPGFSFGDYRNNRHITPIPLWSLERMLAEAGFKLEKVTYNQGYIQKIRMDLPFKNIFLGQTLIVKARKV